MNFAIQKTDIEGLLIINPKIYSDDRGYFFESFSNSLLNEIGIDYQFVQDNQSLSHKNVLRGLHFQKPPFDQGKLVRVIKGSVIDIALDIRKQSITYGKYVSIHLSENNNTMFWIPPGFAHGFVALEDNTIFSYKCTNFYDNASEDGIIWNDNELNIKWGIINPIVSDKDMELPKFANLISPFL